MKNLFFSVILGIGLIFLTTNAALALFISDGTNVGGIDNFIVGGTLGNYGDSTELDWINKQLIYFGYIDDAFTLTEFNKIEDKDVPGDDGITPFFEQIYENSTLATLYSPAAYAFDLGYTPAFYSLKIGGGEGSSDGILLFENVANLQFAAFQLTLPAIQLSLQGADGPVPGADGYTIKNIGKVSHFSTVSTVPEPATMLLLGTGLVGLAGVAVRRRKK